MLKYIAQANYQKDKAFHNYTLYPTRKVLYGQGSHRAYYQWGVSPQASSRAKYKRDGIAGNTQNFKKNNTYTAIEP